MLKNDKVYFLIVLFVLGLFGYLVGRGTYSTDVSSDVIKFDYSLDVDDKNQVIKFITQKTSVSKLIDKVSVLKGYSLETNVLDYTGKIKEISSIVCTGDVLSIKVDNSEFKYGLSVVGDSNGDGRVSLLDLATLRKHIAGTIDENTGKVYEIEGLYYHSANINRDSRVSLVDLGSVRKLVVGNEEIYLVKLGDKEVRLSVNDTYSLKYYVSPDDVSDKSVKWVSSDTKVATVDSSGKVTAVGVGEATITVTTNNSGKKATAKVIVSEAIKNVTSVSLDSTNISLEVGKSKILKATVSPDDASDKSVKWVSSDTKVATVDSSGKVTAVGVGEATITVTTNNSGKKATAKVIVKALENPMLNKVIEVSIDDFRDPAILVENGVYYMYGTGWRAYKNTSGSLDGTWQKINNFVTVPETATADKWAPEVYKYNGYYYMFATYFSSKTQHRGTSVFKSDSPEGPFVEVSNGHVTPHNWDSIDGTLYIDDDGQPWMVFVHEWTSMSDGIGRMATAKLSSDLTSFISEPVELFKSTDASWVGYTITDGCWMYKTKDGQLLMLWSNLDKSKGYAVGIARSKSGNVTGPWTHDSELLYSKAISGKYDGGHGMIFTDTNGQMYLSIHTPNTETTDRKERATFVPIYETNGTLKIVK